MFTKGQRVKIVKPWESQFKLGEIVTIESGPVGPSSGGNYTMTDGRVALGDNLELVNTFDPAKTFCVYDFKNDEEADKVLAILQRIQPLPVDRNNKDLFDISNMSFDWLSDKVWGTSHEDSFSTHKATAHYSATAKEFLEEYGETPRMSKDRNTLGWGYMGSYSDINIYQSPLLTKPNIIKKTMTNIVKFAKDLTLSADEKELRRAGLQDEDGNWTSAAKDIVKNLIAVEAGFKNSGKMINKYHEMGEISYLEFHTAYTKYADQLLETAKAYNAENKKSSS